jgi:translocation and assembly module TamA
MAMFTYLGQRDGIGSPVSADRFDLTAKQLWNIGNYSPPLFVLGIRVQGTMTTANEVTLGQGREQLPIEYRIFLGGDDNLRGFSRQSLNNGGLGYLTAVYIGTELRIVDEMPFNLEPFLLWDGAQLGDRKGTLDRALFTDYGAGLRWRSPFGTLRGSIAQGAILNKNTFSSPYKEELVGFVSFGREF